MVNDTVEEIRDSAVDKKGSFRKSFGTNKPATKGKSMAIQPNKTDLGQVENK